VSYNRAAEHLTTIIAAATGRAKIVLTSRDHHFLTDAEVFSALGERLSTMAGRRVVRLLPFNDRQIEQCLRLRLGDPAGARERMQMLGDVRDLLGLSRNPRMLEFIAGIDPHRLTAARDATGDITAAGLYRQLLEQWIDFELARLDRPGGYPPPTRDQIW